MGNQQGFEENLKRTVVCPICNKEFKIVTNSHLAKHGITVDEFRHRFPNNSLESDYTRYKKSCSGKDSWNNSVNRGNILEGLRSDSSRRKMSQKSFENWNNKELRDRRVSTMRRVDNTEEAKRKFSESAKRVWGVKEFRTKIISGIREATSKEEYRNKQRDNSLRMWRNPEHPEKVLSGYRNGFVKKRFLYTFSDGRCINLRSSYEVTLCSYLEILMINFEYEKYRFDYFLDGFHSYYPDFYLNDLNIFLEVKPRSLTDIEVNILKRQSVLDKGYSIYYVTEDELESINTFQSFLSSSTTIPSAYEDKQKK